MILLILSSPNIIYLAGLNEETLQLLLEEWQQLTTADKSSPAGEKLQEVLGVYAAFMHAACEILNDFMAIFEARMKTINAQFRKDRF